MDSDSSECRRTRPTWTRLETVAARARILQRRDSASTGELLNHRLQSGGTDISYTVTAEEVYLRDAEGEPTASFFTISYAKAGVENPDGDPLSAKTGPI